MTAKQKSSIGLKKALSLLKKVATMVEEDRYCIDVIQQNLAVIGLLKSVNMQLLEGHVHGCLQEAINSKDEERITEMLNELITVVNIAQKK